MLTASGIRGAVMPHQGHCCGIHGCKYGDDSCPVERGWVKQDHPCEDCRADEEDARERVEECAHDWRTMMAQGTSVCWWCSVCGCVSIEDWKPRVNKRTFYFPSPANVGVCGSDLGAKTKYEKGAWLKDE